MATFTAETLQPGVYKSGTSTWAVYGNESLERKREIVSTMYNQGTPRMISSVPSYEKARSAAYGSARGTEDRPKTDSQPSGTPGTPNYNPGVGSKNVLVETPSGDVRSATVDASGKVIGLKEAPPEGPKTVAEAITAEQKRLSEKYQTLTDTGVYVPYKARNEELQLSNILEQMRPKTPKTYETYPTYTGPRPSQPFVAQGEVPESGATVATPFGPSTARLQKEYTQWVVGAAMTPYGGGMGGELTPEAGIQKGFDTLFGRISSKRDVVTTGKLYNLPTIKTTQTPVQQVFASGFGTPQQTFGQAYTPEATKTQYDIRQQQIEQKEQLRNIFLQEPFSYQKREKQPVTTQFIPSKEGGTLETTIIPELLKPKTKETTTVTTTPTTTQEYVQMGVTPQIPSFITNALTPENIEKRVIEAPSDIKAYLTNIPKTAQTYKNLFTETIGGIKTLRPIQALVPTYLAAEPGITKATEIFNRGVKSTIPHLTKQQLGEIAIPFTKTYSYTFTVPKTPYGILSSSYTDFVAALKDERTPQVISRFPQTAKTYVNITKDVYEGKKTISEVVLPSIPFIESRLDIAPDLTRGLTEKKTLNVDFITPFKPDYTEALGEAKYQREDIESIYKAELASVKGYSPNSEILVDNKKMLVSDYLKQVETKREFNIKQVEKTLAKEKKQAAFMKKAELGLSGFFIGSTFGEGVVAAGFGANLTTKLLGGTRLLGSLFAGEILGKKAEKTYLGAKQAVGLGGEPTTLFSFPLMRGKSIPITESGLLAGTISLGSIYPIYRLSGALTEPMVTAKPRISASIQREGTLPLVSSVSGSKPRLGGELVVRELPRRGIISQKSTVSPWDKTMTTISQTRSPILYESLGRKYELTPTINQRAFFGSSLEQKNVFEVTSKSTVTGFRPTYFGKSKISYVEEGLSSLRVTGERPSGLVPAGKYLAKTKPSLLFYEAGTKTGFVAGKEVASENFIGLTQREIVKQVGVGRSILPTRYREVNIYSGPKIETTYTATKKPVLTTFTANLRVPKAGAVIGKEVSVGEGVGFRYLTSRRFSPTKVVQTIIPSKKLGLPVETQRFTRTLAERFNVLTGEMNKPRQISSVERIVRFEAPQKGVYTLESSNIMLKEFKQPTYDVSGPYIGPSGRPKTPLNDVFRATPKEKTIKYASPAEDLVKKGIAKNIKEAKKILNAPSTPNRVFESPESKLMSSKVVEEVDISYAWAPKTSAVNFRNMIQSFPQPQVPAVGLASNVVLRGFSQSPIIESAKAQNIPPLLPNIIQAAEPSLMPKIEMKRVLEQPSALIHSPVSLTTSRVTNLVDTKSLTNQINKQLSEVKNIQTQIQRPTQKLDIQSVSDQISKTEQITNIITPTISSGTYTWAGGGNIIPPGLVVPPLIIPPRGGKGELFGGSKRGKTFWTKAFTASAEDVLSLTVGGKTRGKPKILKIKRKTKKTTKKKHKKR